MSSTEVSKFIATIEDGQKRADAQALVGLMQDVSGHQPRMWGSSIVGFGDHHYAYASGREGDTFVLGFAPRKQNLTLYLPGYLEQYAGLLDGLGKHSTGKGCLYLKRLGDADPGVLRRLLEAAVATRPTG